MAKHILDPDLLHRALRTLPRADLLVLLDRALERVPRSRVPEIVEGLIPIQKLAPRKPRRLLEVVQAFDAASRRGDYYDSFDVNSRNFSQTSEGTADWIAECERLFDDVLAISASADAAEVRQAFELLLALLRRIDEGEDDIVFFADEGGSWQVHVKWANVLPSYFRSLAATAAPEEYARLVDAVIRDFVRHERSKYLPKARGVATREQKVALASLVGPPKMRSLAASRGARGRS